MSAARPPADDNALPHEPDALSELLRATHVFSIEVVGIDATAWRPGADGLAHRQLRMTVALLDRHKGRLSVARGQRFPFAVEQRREGEYEFSGYHGLWSHTQPEVGTRYLIVARGPEHDPAKLMEEGSTERLFDGGAATDVAAATVGEQLSHGDAAGVRALWDFSFEQRASLGELYARYLWERTRGVFARDGAGLLPEVRRVLLAPDTAIALRAELDKQMYLAVLDLDREPALTAAVVKVLLEQLLLTTAEPLRDGLVDVQLHGLIFPAGAAPLPGRDVGLSPQERGRLVTAVGTVHSERAQRLQQWLGAA